MDSFLLVAGGFVLGWLCACVVIIAVGDRFDIIGIFRSNGKDK